jgi:hypothetical protein
MPARKSGPNESERHRCRHSAGPVLHKVTGPSAVTAETKIEHFEKMAL